MHQPALTYTRGRCRDSCRGAVVPRLFIVMRVTYVMEMIVIIEIYEPSTNHTRISTQGLGVKINSSKLSIYLHLLQWVLCAYAERAEPMSNEKGVLI